MDFTKEIYAEIFINHLPASKCKFLKILRQ
jgi:hypothetical protein